MRKRVKTQHKDLQKKQINEETLYGCVACIYEQDPEVPEV